MKNKILFHTVFVVLLSGCTIHPAGEIEQRRMANDAGKHYEQPALCVLPDRASLDDLIQYALQTNADLEGKYWEWRAAIEQIPQDGTQTTTVNLAAGTSITHGRASLGNSTLALSNDPMTDIKWPSKLDAAAKAALDNAQAAGWRFIKAKFEIRRQVIIAYDNFSLTARRIQLEQQNLLLLRSNAAAIAERTRAGTALQQEVLKSQNEVDLSHNDLDQMHSQLRAQLAAINGLLNRPAEAPIWTSGKSPPILSLHHSDDQILALAIQRNPEMASLADEITAKRESLRLAKLQYIPEFNISIGTDLLGVTQSLLGQATIPLFRYEAINAGIAQAEANIKTSQARRRQARSDLGSTLVTDLSDLHDKDRELVLFNSTLIPRLVLIVGVTRSSYETGQAALPELLEAERSLLAIQRSAEEISFNRENDLAEIESLTIDDAL